MNERIRALRRKKKLTQAQLAIACGHKYNSVVAGWETGRRRPSLDDLPLLAKALDTTIGYIVAGDNAC